LRSYSTDYRYFSAAGFSMGEGSDNQRVARQWGQPELRGGLHLTPVGTTPAGLAAALLQGCGLPHGSVRAGLALRKIWLTVGIGASRFFSVSGLVMLHIHAVAVSFERLCRQDAGGHDDEDTTGRFPH